MEKIILVCWKENDAQARMASLRAAGFEVEWVLPEGQDFIKRMEADPPDAILIDLERLPSHGREYGLHLRLRKGTRAIPLVFTGGQADKDAVVKALLPDAGFCTWEDATQALRQAIQHPLKNPIVPESVFVAYSGKSLAEKLGIKRGKHLVLLNAPADFRWHLGELPEGVIVDEKFSTEAELALWFVKSKADLVKEISKIVENLGIAHLWIAWPSRLPA